MINSSQMNSINSESKICENSENSKAFIPFQLHQLFFKVYNMKQIEDFLIVANVTKHVISFVRILCIVTQEILSKKNSKKNEL